MFGDDVDQTPGAFHGASEQDSERSLSRESKRPNTIVQETPLH